HIGFRIRSQTGEIIFATNTYCMGEKIGAVNVGELLTVSFNFDVPLRDGEYTITVGIAESGFGEGQFKQMLAWKNDVVLLRVFRNRESIIWAGIVNLTPSVSIQKQIHV
ncbi:MAG: Wzt carbohydrate-binding domain-containing protein, partial [Coleofasciculaceae cyanobacterium]